MAELCAFPFSLIAFRVLTLPIFPIRQGRSPNQIGRKGKDKGRWTIGIKLCWPLDTYGRVVEWAWTPQGTPDKAFNWMAGNLDGQTITLADLGFRDVNGIPANLILCAKGKRNERMPVETALSMLTMIADLKRLHHRVADYLWMHLAYATAMFNTLLALFHQLHPEESAFKMSIAEFSLSSTSCIGYYFNVDDVKEIAERVGYQVMDILIRYPYKDAEYQSKRAYFVVRKPKRD